MKGTITINPFARSQLTTSECMMLVLLAMLPGAGYGLYSYGAHALLLMLISVGSAVLFEAVFELLSGRKLTVFDGSAAVTGLCLALVLPPSAPWWFPLVGNAVGIVAAKQLFGGIGKNVFNPAATGKLILCLAFHGAMTDFSGGGYASDTPLMVLSKGGTIDLGQMLLGNVPGSIGTASAVCVLIGAAFLFLTGIIRLDIPLAAIVSFSVIYLLFGGHGLSAYYLAAQLVGGSFLFTVFFMANDFATTPVGKRARIVYGVLLGILIALFRILGSRENAALYALILTNVTARFLDERLAERPFGTATARRRTRIVSEKSPEERERSRREKEEEERSLAARFQNFENTMVPQNAQNSETAGTINRESMDLYQNRTAVAGNPSAFPQQGQAPYLDPNMGTGPLPYLDPNMGTGPMPNLDPNMGTGPMPNLDPNMGTGPMPNLDPNTGTGPMPYLDPNMGTGPLPPYQQNVPQQPAPVPQQQAPVYQNPNPVPNPGYADPYQQQVPPAYGQPYPQAPYQGQPGYGVPYQNPGAVPPQQQQIPPQQLPPQQGYYDPMQYAQQPYYGYGAPQPQMPYGTQPQQQQQLPPLQAENMSAGRTAQQLAEEEEARRQAQEELEQQQEEERKARLERIHRSPRAVEARLRRNRQKRLEESESLEEELRQKQRARQEIRDAVRWDDEEDRVSDSLQYIDLTQGVSDSLDFDESRKNEQETREDASLAGLMTENIPVEQIEKQLAAQQQAPQQGNSGTPSGEDPYGTPAGAPNSRQQQEPENRHEEDNKR
ncbi:MAG: RnfABCDGE type electron transport complex subunit D [Firmicutes bacterium]|nr:RnfABCDGE type electron transport complex subunit D [Bacillota bacterium]